MIAAAIKDAAEAAAEYGDVFIHWDNNVGGLAYRGRDEDGATVTGPVGYEFETCPDFSADCWAEVATALRVAGFTVES